MEIFMGWVGFLFGKIKIFGFLVVFDFSTFIRQDFIHF
jgi:hypothetical protein